MSEPSLHKDGPTTRPAAPATAARNSLNIFTTRLLTLPITILTSILVAIVLGPANRGIYGFLVLMGGFALPLLMFGFGASVTYFISNKRYAVRDIFLTCVTVGVMQGTVGACLLGLLWYFDLLGETAAATPPHLMLLVLLTLPMQGATLTLNRVALGDSWFSASNRIAYATAILTSTMLLLLVVMAQLGLRGAVIGMVTNQVLLLTASTIASIRRFRPVLAWNTTFLREGARYGLKAWVGDVVGYSNLRLDQWILGMVAKSEVLGTYALAVSFAEMLWMLPDSLAHVLFNKVAAVKDVAQRQELIERMNRVVFWTLAVAGVAVVFAAPGIVYILGDAYAATAVPLALLMPGTVAMTVHKVLTKYFGGVGKPHLSGTTAGIGGLVGSLLYFVLIPRYGAVGAAIASSGCYIVTAVTAVVVYRRLVAPHKARLFRPNLADAAWLDQQARLAIRSRQPTGG
ncbi:MAG TPA: oligosaccharide flippase family protein [Pirellulales bacterium]